MSKKILVPPMQINDQSIRRFFNDIANAFNERLGSIPDDSTAADVPTLLSDFNELLEVLR